MEDRAILVVDDEENILNAIERELYFWQNENGIKLYKANSGPRALELLEQHKDSIRVLVSDLKMAGMAGDQLIHEVKKRYPDIRSILITGYSEMGGVSRAVGAGITAFIQKPWETRALIEEIEKALSSFAADAMNREYRSRLVSQLEQTGRIQQKLFYHRELPSANYHVDVTYRPMDEFRCGGDFYEVLSISEDRCIIIIGDVAGHGVEAAFVTGIVHTLISRENLDRLATADFSPGIFLTGLNRMIAKELAGAPELVVSLTVAFLDYAEGRLVVSNAGNLPVYLIRPEECLTYSASGYPCGVSLEAVFSDLTVQVRSKDLVAFMTDGLIERGRSEGYINLTAIKSVFSRFVDAPDFNTKIVNFLLEMFPKKRFFDDMTLITVRLK